MWREALLPLGNSPFTMSQDSMLHHRAATVLRRSNGRAVHLL
jgi:hypothetical protein